MLTYVGLWMRFVIFLFLAPFNNDGQGHYEYILYIQQHLALPPSATGHEAWQPPLYYIITAVLSFLNDSPKFLQTFSLALSVCSLFIARKIICFPGLFTSSAGMLIAMAITSLLPQYVMFSLYLSNDSLAIFLGLSAIWRFCLFSSVPRLPQLLSLFTVLALGLLTKAQFVAIAPIMGLSALAISTRLPGRMTEGSAHPIARISCAILLMLSPLKYAQNWLLYHKLFVTSLDFSPPWAQAQKGTYIGFRSALDFNIIKLVHSPTLSPTTMHSIPLLLYGTFWYQYIPESNFHGNENVLLKRIGSSLYIIGILPAMFMILGAFCLVIQLSEGAVRQFRRKAPNVSAGSRAHKESPLVPFVIITCFIGNVAMILISFSQWDVWSILQARSAFPTLLGGHLLVDRAMSRLGIGLQLAKSWCFVFATAVLCYFVSEIWLLIP